jgi:hypothetical protein
MHIIILIEKKNTTVNTNITIWNELGQPYVEHIYDDYFGGFEGAEVKAVQLI